MSKKNLISTIIFISIIFIVMIGVIVALIIGGNKKEKVIKNIAGIGLEYVIEEQSTEKVEEIDSTEDFVKSNFMEGCLSEANFQYNYCNCTYDYMLDNMGFEDFVKQSVEYELTDVLNEEIEENMIGAMVECLDKYNY